MRAAAILFAMAAVAAACSRESANANAHANANSHASSHANANANAIGEPGAVAVKAPTKELVEPPRPKELEHVTIKALGMYCEDSCPVKVRYALADITAVYELGFDVSKESIFVSYDASLGTAKEVTKPMIAAIKQSGFDPWLAKEEWPADAKAQVVLR